MEETNTPHTQSKIKTFFSSLTEYLMYVGTSTLLIYYLFKSILGVPSNLKENTENIKDIQLNVDTVKGMSSFLMERFYNIEQSQTKINQQQEGTVSNIQELSKEINSLKKLTHFGLQETNKQIRALSTEVSKIKNTQTEPIR